MTAPIVLGSPGIKKYIVEANGTGVAFIDYDDDGRLDIFLVNGTRFEEFAKGKEPVNRLYHNRGAGRFVDVTAGSGIARSGWGNGVCAGDFDADGKGDLYVTYWGPNSLFRNKGDGAFEDVAAGAGAAGPKQEWSTGCTFLDYDRDGNLDLFVASYVAFDPKRTPLPGQQQYCIFRDAPVFCGPRGLPHGTVTLYRNVGGGKFEDVSVAAGMRKVSGFYAFTATAADLNADGWTDIYVACDSTPSLYFRNNKNGTFTELATESGIAYNQHGTEQAGMGVAIADYDNDGWMDITKTNFIRDYPNLYRNIGKAIFEDAALAAGLGVNPNFVLWGTGFEDFDNDGWRDIFQVAGHVYPNIQKIDPDEPYANPRLVYRNLGNGKFEDVSRVAGPGISARHASRGAAFGDFDNDGDMDVLIMNMDEPPSLLRNELRTAGNWVKIRLRGEKPNRPVMGATVSVHSGGTVQTAPLLSQSSYLSVNDSRLHFGLGSSKAIEKVVVRWPSGVTEEFEGALPGHMAVLVEGARKAQNIRLEP